MVYSYEGEERLFTGHSGQIFILLTVIWLCVSLTSRLLPPLLPIIVDDLQITAFFAGVALTAERVARASAEFPSGKISDKLSRTTVLVWCIIFGITGTLILSISVSYILFVGGLIVFGLGRGMYSPAARALLSDIFERKRGSAFGFNMLGSEIAGILGAGIAIIIVGFSSWRAAFAPIALALLILLFIFYSVSREPVYYKWVTMRPRKTGMRIFKNKRLRWITLVYSLYVLAASGVSTFLPLFLIEIHGVSFAFASSAFALLYVMGLLAKPMGGILSDRHPRLITASGSLLVGSVGLGMLVLAPSQAVAIAGVIIYALGYRGVPPGLQAYLMDQFPTKSMGGDLGAMRTIYLSIGSLGPAYAGFAANSFGFIIAFFSFVLFYAIGAVVLWWGWKIWE